MNELGGHEMSPHQERSCFPVGQQSISHVNKEIQIKFDGDLGRFADTEMDKIDRKEPQIKGYIDRSFGWYSDMVPEAERNAFVDGAAFVHRILVEQGTIPVLPEDLSGILDQEEAAYQRLADQRNETLGETLSGLHESGFSRIQEPSTANELSPISRALKERLATHPSPPSFAAGAEMLYSALKRQDLKNLESEADLIDVDDLDRELAELTGGK